MQAVDHLLHRLGHAAAGGKAYAGGTGLVVGGQIGDLAEVDALGLEHSPQLLEGDDKIHITADTAAAGLQLFGGAGTDKDNTAPGTPALLQPRRQHHRRHGHGDIRRKAGELLFGHHGPGRTAGGRHKWLLLRHHTQKFLGLLHRAQIGAHGYLLQRGEPQLLHSGLDLPRRYIVSELAPECRCDHRHHLVAPTDGVDQLEQLALIHDRAEGAIHQTHTAADALVIVDLGVAVLILTNGIHAAGLLAGPGKLDDGVVGTGIPAFAALDALILVDMRLSAFDSNGPFRAGILAMAGQTALAGIRDLIVSRRAAVTGVFYDVHQWRIVVLLRDGTLLHPVAEQTVLRHRPQGQAHSQPYALAYDSPFQKDGLPLVAHLTGDDLVGQLFHTAVVSALIGQPRHLGKHLLTHIRDGAFKVSHRYTFPPKPPIFCYHYNKFIMENNVQLREFLSPRECFLMQPAQPSATAVKALLRCLLSPVPQGLLQLVQRLFFNAGHVATRLL